MRNDVTGPRTVRERLIHRVQPICFLLGAIGLDGCALSRMHVDDTDAVAGGTGNHAGASAVGGRGSTAADGGSSNQAGGSTSVGAAGGTSSGNQSGGNTGTGSGGTYAAEGGALASGGAETGSVAGAPSGGVTTTGTPPGGTGNAGGGVATERCANQTGELAIANKPGSGSALGGSTKVTAASELTIPLAEIEFRVCLAVFTAPTNAIAVSALRFDYAALTTTTAPYFVSLAALPFVVETVSSTEVCLLSDFANYSAASTLSLVGTGAMSLDWRIDTSAFGDATVDSTRPAEIVVSRQGATAACVSAN